MEARLAAPSEVHAIGSGDLKGDTLSDGACSDDSDPKGGVQHGGMIGGFGMGIRANLFFEHGLDHFADF